MSVPRFWREIPQRYNLQASRCGTCQAIHFPPREVCPTCRRASVGKMQAVKLSGQGVVLEFTRVHKPAPGYTLQVPYYLALIQSVEGPVITGQIVDSDPATIAVGAKVKGVFRRLGQDGEDGVIYYGTKWQIVPMAPPAQAAEAPAAQPEPARKAGKATPPKPAKRRGLGRKKKA